MSTAPPHHELGSRRHLRALARLHDRPVNFVVDRRPSPDDPGGWQVDAYRRALPSEAPGPPTADGSWAIARRVLARYEFADPRMIRTVHYPETPLEGRDMLLVGRFFGLRFLLGVRVGGVVDTWRTVDGRRVRIWGWDYKTLQGHLETGQMDYEVWKWLDTGEVEFRMSRFFRTAEIPNPLVRLGWKLFGRWMQRRFVRRAAGRMEGFVRWELGVADPRPTRAATTVRAASFEEARPVGRTTSTVRALGPAKAGRPPGRIRSPRRQPGGRLSR